MVDQAHKPEPTEDLPWPLQKYYYAIYKAAQTDFHVKLEICIAIEVTDT